MLYFWLVVSVYGDNATNFRQGLSPFVFYDFLDASNNNNYSYPTAQDLAQSLIKFGDLDVNPNRSSWLWGAPGIKLNPPSEKTASSALTSSRGFEISWQPTFQSGFVVELWAQSLQWGSAGDLLSLSPTNTRAGTTEDSLICNSSEPLFILRNQGPSEQLEYQYSRLPSSPRQQCVYNGAQVLRPNTETQAIFIKVLPNAPSVAIYTLHGQASREAVEVNPFVGNMLAWNISNNTAKLHFLRGNDYSTFGYNLLSFAIYPPLSEDTIYALSSMGLPNAKPFAKSFKRAFPESGGGFIRFCVNGPTSRDSDCPDYSNRWEGGKIMVLTNSSSLKVFIVSLPDQGVLYSSPDGRPLSASSLPFLLPSSNTIEYRAPLAMSSWYVTSWTSAKGYEWAKTDLTSFKYMVQDPQGVNSSVSTVVVEVFPQHKAPLALDVNASNIFAGKPMNTIELAPVVTEYLLLSPNTTCASYGMATDRMPVLCLTQKDRAEVAYVTITSLPQFGTLYSKVEGQFVALTVNSTVAPVCTVGCTFASVLVYYNSSLRNDYSEPVTFNYTVTTRFANPQLATTRYDIDESPTIGPEPVAFASTVESAPATVRFRLRDGLYAVDGESLLKQSTTQQVVTLAAADLTAQGPLSLTAIVTSLPSKGLLSQADGKAINAAQLPVTVSGNMTLLYSPNVTRTMSYTDSFTFFARSQGRDSPPAIQTLQILDINDPPAIILPFNRNTFERTGMPQSWGDLGEDTELFINFTDPDPPFPNEPFYRVSLVANLAEFTIFMSPSAWSLLQPNFSNPTQMIGLSIGAGVAGGGSNEWRFVASRSVALQALNPLRLRANKPSTNAPLTVKVEDCIIAPGWTDRRFAGPNWMPLADSVTVYLTGRWVEEKPYMGIADMRIVYTIYGVATFILIVLCVACFFCVRCFCRHRREAKEKASAPHETEGLIPDKKNEAPARIHI